VLGEFVVKIKDVLDEGIFSKKSATNASVSLNHWVKKWDDMRNSGRVDDEPGDLKNYVSNIVKYKIDADQINTPTFADMQNPKAYIEKWLNQYYKLPKGKKYKSANPLAQQTQTTPAASVPAPTPTTPTPAKKQISVKDHAGVLWVKDPHDQIWRSSETNDEVTDKSAIFKLEKEALRTGQYPQQMSTKSGIPTPNANIL
jgi:hypothetical protein